MADIIADIDQAVSNFETANPVGKHTYDRAGCGQQVYEVPSGKAVYAVLLVCSDLLDAAEKTAVKDAILAANAKLQAVKLVAQGVTPAPVADHTVQVKCSAHVRYVRDNP